MTTKLVLAMISLNALLTHHGCPFTYRFIGPLDSAQAYGLLCASSAPLTGSNSVAIIFIVCFCLFNPVAYLASLVVFLNHWPFPMGLSVVHLSLSQIMGCHRICIVLD